MSEDLPSLFIGNQKPNDMKTYPNGEEPTQGEVVAFELANNIFSAGFEHHKSLKDGEDDRITPESKEEMIEGLKEDPEISMANNGAKWLAESVEVGDLILTVPFGKNSPIRFLGRFSSDWYYRNDGLHHYLDTYNIRDVEDWVYVHKDELPEKLRDEYRQPVIQHCAKATDEDIRGLERLYENRKN